MFLIKASTYYSTDGVTHKVLTICHMCHIVNIVSIWMAEYPEFVDEKSGAQVIKTIGGWNGSDCKAGVCA